MRKNILHLKPYSTARDEYQGDLGICLDANENPYNNQINRYPDPHHHKLKDRVALLKDLAPEQIFIGAGSDESIDHIYRIFCNPGVDNVISIAPSYGMYQVCAELNDIEFRTVQLEADFSLNTGKLLAACDLKTKVIFLCSPNNPSGNDFPHAQMVDILNRFDGMVVVDEAYIDFSTQKSMRYEIAHHPNLIVLQTLSKAWGMANLRVGFSFACREVIETMYRVKHPYNLSGVIQELAYEHLGELSNDHVQRLVEQREFMALRLSALEDVLEVYPSSANFLLVKMKDAKACYHHLLAHGIIVRDRSSIPGCEQCLRITIGTEEENQAVLDALHA